MAYGYTTDEMLEDMRCEGWRVARDFRRCDAERVWNAWTAVLLWAIAHQYGDETDGKWL